MSMYQASAPVFVQSLTALSGILDKAAAYAAEKKIDQAALLGMRLNPTMWPLSKQIQAACTTATGCAARLAGVPVPTMEDTEKTLPELKARIARSVEFIKGLEASQIDGSEARDISMRMGGNDVSFKGQNYLMWFAMPNFMFHATTAYNILRQSGLELVKRDFLGKNPAG